MRFEIYERGRLVAIQDGPLEEEEMLTMIEIQHFLGRSVRIITDHMEQTIFMPKFWEIIGRLVNGKNRSVR